MLVKMDSRQPVSVYNTSRSLSNAMYQFWLSYISLFSYGYIMIYTLWLFNIAMENRQFIDGLPIKNSDFPWLC